jgi:hypothetical protein
MLVSTSNWCFELCLLTFLCALKLLGKNTAMKRARLCQLFPTKPASWLLIYVTCITVYTPTHYRSLEWAMWYGINKQACSGLYSLFQPSTIRIQTVGYIGALIIFSKKLHNLKQVHLNNIYVFSKYITQNCHRMLYKGKLVNIYTVVCSENHSKSINALFKQDTEFLYITVGGRSICSYQ